MANRLAHETSPYLQQHADNPVDWYPWSDDALSLARRENKPILLSVGYSACHWCHVMAHESFEDDRVAAIMNRLFVNIKVDREERPDIDQIYQTAHQLLTRRAGGWPLTMFLTPDGKPFFGGTYFPKEPRYNLPGFGGLLERVAQVYRDQRESIDQQNDELVAIMGRTLPQPGEGTIDGKVLSSATRELLNLVDPVEGGLGNAPKFPHPYEFDFMLRQSVLEKNSKAKDAVILTLTKMANGGIYDHLGGGFCRYSVDGLWMIPHFEKMLYDNGPLLRLYADAWLVTRDESFKRVCEDTAAWVMREMQSSEGGYYSSLDADSEGEEGKFYVWSREDITQLLDTRELQAAAARYGLDEPPNFEHEFWHLRVTRSIEAVSAILNVSVEQCNAAIQSARAKLFLARSQRVRPGRDEKILTSWNAMMIEGMAHAARVFHREDWLQSARSALEFVRTTLWRDGRLFATHKDGKTHLNAYLDDYACLLAALLEMLQTDFRLDYLRWAQRTADVLLDQFQDTKDGGFFFTAHDHEQLILRTKPGHDNATPSGNGIAALNLIRLGHLVGNVSYLDAAERSLRLFSETMATHASACPSLLRALEAQLNPPEMVILTGPTQSMSQWREPLDQVYAPSALVLSLPSDHEGLPAALAKPVRAEVNAWVCRGVECLPPMAHVGQVFEEIRVAAQ